MARCSACGRIMLGGIRIDGYRYCTQRCRKSHALISVSDMIEPDVINAFATQIHSGPCPKCKGSGPVDIHKHYQIWSALVMTRWSSRSQVSCRRCALKSQAGGLVSTLLLGWWGFPWGLIFTPVQICRNITAMVRPPNPAAPSDNLKRLAKLQLASRVSSPASPRQP